MGKDMDRDILEKITDLISECKTLLETINDNKFIPHITQQPVDFTGAVGSTATFTVVANNVKDYQWQVRSTSSGSWSNSGSSGNKTATLSVPITTTRYNYRYRCKITGLDNSVIYSDSVKMIEPET